MTLFEYLAIAFSLLFSFSGMRLVGGLPHATRSSVRYWIHLSFVGLQLLITVVIFWAFWSFRNVAWNLPTFLLVLTSPGLLYYNACTLIPENSSAVESWHDYYYSVRRRYFIGFSCWILAIISISTIVFDLPLLHPARAVQAALLCVGVVGAFSTNSHVHASLVMFLLALLPIAATLLFRPGSVGSFTPQ